MKKYVFVFGCAYTLAAAVVAFLIFTTIGCARQVPIPQIDDAPIVSAPAAVEQQGPRFGAATYAGEEKIEQPQDQQLTVYFDYNSSILTEATKAGIAELGKVTFETKQKITIIGGCSPEGSDEYNVGLGLSRAVAVKNYLTEYGISESRIDVSSVGENNLVSTMESEYWKDRRATITVQ